jgi:hypothetical protein
MIVSKVFWTLLGLSAMSFAVSTVLVLAAIASATLSFGSGLAICCSAAIASLAPILSVVEWRSNNAADEWAGPR